MPTVPVRGRGAKRLEKTNNNARGYHTGRRAASAKKKKTLLQGYTRVKLRGRTHKTTYDAILDTIGVMFYLGHFWGCIGACSHRVRCDFILLYMEGMGQIAYSVPLGNVAEFCGRKAKFADSAMFTPIFCRFYSLIILLWLDFRWLLCLFSVRCDHWMAL